MERECLTSGPGFLPCPLMFAAFRDIFTRHRVKEATREVVGRSVLNECALRNASRRGLVLVNSRGALAWWMTRGRGVVRGVLL